MAGCNVVDACVSFVRVVTLRLAGVGLCVCTYVSSAAWCGRPNYQAIVGPHGGALQNMVCVSPITLLQLLL